eukprot:TRINITY_DN6040_c0_g1_i1.p1 TRINITY_DN6040_c0_g1~~TRINITY_DN6040_c0_g1_i1.p1  ORF type:complete len:245 (-),score=36.76 TRINITY_DN6040_c0_g1_i1:165-899(-)
MAPKKTLATITITEAHNLKAGDKDGSSDPFVKCKIVGHHHYLKTPVIKHTLDPIWSSHNTFKIAVREGDTLIFEIWDKDQFGKDFLGVASFVPTQENEGDHVLELGSRVDHQDCDITGVLHIQYASSAIVVEKNSHTKIEKDFLVPLLEGDFDGVMAKFTPAFREVVEEGLLQEVRDRLINEYGMLLKVKQCPRQDNTAMIGGVKVREMKRCYKFENGNVSVLCKWRGDLLCKFNVQYSKLSTN